MPVKVIGLDVSLNHWGIVSLLDGELENYWFVTTENSIVKKLKEHSIFIDLPKRSKEESQIFSIKRLAALEKMLINFLKEHPVDYYGIEDYAFAMQQGSHQLGEMGGMVRLNLYKAGKLFRLHDPNSIKMFSTGNGSADKNLMEKGLKAKYNIDFLPCNPISKNGKMNKAVSEDLYDALAIAKLVWTEVLLRKGNIKLNELTESEIKVFNRVTKSYPVNILARDWL
jgi:Holliday junction resolvasome RuvABC endonuclease subunit